MPKPTKTLPVVQKGVSNEVMRRLGLLTCLAVYFCEGVNASIMAPLFPPHALEVGLTETEIGLVQGIFDISSFCAQFVIASVITPQTRKMFYAVGIFVSGACIVLFGYTGNATDPKTYFILSACVRATMGIGACLVYSGTVPLVNKLYPEKAGLLTSIAQASLGFGAMMGPALGSSLSSLGDYLGYNGFTMPFYMYGSFETSLTLCVILFIPSSTPFLPDKGRKKLSKQQYFKFITGKYLMLLSIPLISMYAMPGFKDVAYSPYIEESVGVEVDMIGYVFMAMSVCYLCSAPFWGYLIQNGYAGYVLTFSLFSSTFSFFLFYLPKLQPQLNDLSFTIFVLCINGLSLSALFGSCYIIFEKIAEKSGFIGIESNKLMVASWFSTIRSLGRIIGAFLVGGVLLQSLKFHNTCLVYFCLDLALSIFGVSIIFLLGLYKMTYYTVKTDEAYELELTDSTLFKVARPKSESRLEKSFKASLSSMHAI